MGWAVLLTLLICMAASAVSVYPGERADGISRKLCAAAFCCMAATGFWAFVGRPGAFADFASLPAGTAACAAAAVICCVGAGTLAAALSRRFRG